MNVELIQLLKHHFGPVYDYFDDEQVTEVMANPDGFVWVEDHVRGMRCTDHVMSVEDRMVILQAVADFNNELVTEDKPSFAGVMPQTGARFHGMISPAVDAPAFTIRMPARRTFSVREYLESGALTKVQTRLLVDAVKGHKNILVAGSTGSGKTTFGNALLRLISQTDDRVMLIEDTPELVCEAPNTFAVRVDRHSYFNYQQALVDALRMRPDRIVVGELRDGLATLELLKAWNTGHSGGIATIHANNARSSLPRVEQLLAEVIKHTPRALICEAINVVVFMERYAIGGGASARRVADVACVSNDLSAQGNYVFEHHFHPSISP